MANFDDYLLGQSIAFMQQRREKKKMSKFKVGDRVVLCKPIPFVNIGNEGVIVKADKWSASDEMPYYVEFDKGYSFWMREDQLRLKEERKMTKFKAGDKIRVVNFNRELNGKIGEIVCFDGSDFRPYEVLMHDCRETQWFLPYEMELVEEKEMENVKSLLKSGDIVVFGSGEKAKVFLDYEPSLYHGKGILAYIKKRSYMVLSDYNDDLFTSSENEYYTINKIYRPKHDGCVMSNNLNDYDLIWERKEVKEMTMKEICDALGCEVKIKKED